MGCYLAYHLTCICQGKSPKGPIAASRDRHRQKTFAKGRKYISILYNLDNSTVEAIEEGHDTEAAKSCFSQLSQEQLQSIEAIAMDISSAFVLPQLNLEF